jgi:hypothetical protein
VGCPYSFGVWWSCLHFEVLDFGEGQRVLLEGALAGFKMERSGEMEMWWLVGGEGKEGKGEKLHFFPSTWPRLRFGSMMSLTRRLSSLVSRYKVSPYFVT